ncbi:MAG: hypothetical protein EZS28_035785 [Streblomastix strix]|uniref:Uncharacterized protein n=1 Tax=Streblomastix strix TaxID=222440 RepID=A0A5J4UDQ0_9EUKA|nr:MAG: hypothetical protein EZS28_035785 [Streblomastix strix]
MPFVPKKTNTNSLVSTVANQKELYTSGLGDYFLKSPAAQTAGTQLLLAPNVKGAAPTLSEEALYMRRDRVNVLDSVNKSFVIQRNSGTNNYNEGLRINRSHEAWACLVIGGMKDSIDNIDTVGYGVLPVTQTTGYSTWAIGTNLSGDLYIGMTSGGYGGLEFKRDGNINYISPSGTKYNVLREVVILGNLDLGISTYDQSGQNYAPFYMGSNHSRALTLQIQGRQAILSGYLILGAYYTHIGIDACSTGTFSIPNKYLPKVSNKENVIISIALNRSGSTSQKVDAADGWFNCPSSDSGSTALNYRQSTDWAAGYHNEII